MPSGTPDRQPATWWFVGPSVPGLLDLGTKHDTVRGGDIDKEFADKFGQKAVVFGSISAASRDNEIGVVATLIGLHTLFSLVIVAHTRKPRAQTLGVAT